MTDNALQIQSHPILLCISADQHFLFRFEIKWINLSIILFCHKFLGSLSNRTARISFVFPVLEYSGSSALFAYSFFFKQGHRILKNPVSIAAIFLNPSMYPISKSRPVYSLRCLWYYAFLHGIPEQFQIHGQKLPPSSAYKLRALLEDRRFLEIFQPEEVCSSSALFAPIFGVWISVNPS